MRPLLLTTVAAAAFAALTLQVGAQNTDLKRDQGMTERMRSGMDKQDMNMKKGSAKGLSGRSSATGQAAAGMGLDAMDQMSVSPGMTVPKGVRLNRIPRDMAKFTPNYRGYRFAMTSNNILIVDPRTRRVVTVYRGEGRSAVTTPRH